MTCNRCGCVTDLAEQRGGTEEGRFKEVYECVQGHEGYITGEASDHPQDWTKYGPVFEE